MARYNKVAPSPLLKDQLCILSLLQAPPPFTSCSSVQWLLYSDETVKSERSATSAPAQPTTSLSTPSSDQSPIPSSCTPNLDPSSMTDPS
ncbi:hypothetical protein ACFX13_039260 [Malus domestica]